jgi:uncharacterized protein DUF6916
MLRESAYPSRRMLLAGLGAGAVGVAASAAPVLSLRPTGALSGGSASWWDRTFLSLQAAGLSEWGATVGQTFTLGTPNGSHLLRVAAVTAFPGSGPRPATLGRSQAFFVVFESGAGPSLPAGDSVYQLAHSTYPSLPIYMSAPSTVARKTRLVAVFN